MNTAPDRRAFLGTLAALTTLGTSRSLALASPVQSTTAGASALRVFAAGPGSAFLPYATGLAAYLRATGVDAVAVETTGSIENIRRLGQDTRGVATVFMGTAFEAYTGIGAWNDGTAFHDLRALFPMYETSLQLAALTSSGIRRLADLREKTVGVGPQGGPAALYLSGLAGALGLELTPVYGQPAELVDSLLAGRIDALWQGAPSPIPALAVVATRASATVCGLSSEEQDVMLQRFPFLSRATVAGGTYPGQSATFGSVGAWNFVLAHKALPDERAYRVTRIALDAREPRTQIDPSAGGTVAANASRNTFLPFHPGALRYYRGRGIDVGLR